MSEMASMAGVESMAGDDMAVMPGHDGCPPVEQGPVGANPDAPCPFTAAASFGGCVSVAAVAAQVEALLTPPTAVGMIRSAALELDLLLAASLFHPPRA